MNKIEKKTVSKMIYIYCGSKHSTPNLCPDCQSLLDYAMIRLSKCKFGENKPTCQKCPAHCYSKVMQEKMRIVMRFSGPKILFHNPILAIKHLLRRLKK